MLMRKEIKNQKFLTEGFQECFEKFTDDVFDCVEIDICNRTCNMTMFLGKNSIIYNILANDCCSYGKDQLLSCSGLTIDELNKSISELTKMGFIKLDTFINNECYKIAYIEDSQLIKLLSEHDTGFLMARYRKVVEDNDFVIDIEKLKTERRKYFSDENL